MFDEVTKRGAQIYIYQEFKRSKKKKHKLTNLYFPNDKYSLKCLNN